jgi:hypothetical protein
MRLIITLSAIAFVTLSSSFAADRQQNMSAVPHVVAERIQGRCTDFGKAHKCRAKWDNRSSQCVCQN